MATVEDRAAGEGIRWRRAFVGGVLLEAVLLLLAVPVLAIVPNPFSGTGPAGGDFTLFYAIVAIECFVAGAVGGMWVGRPLTSGRALHGAIAGGVATVIYLVICSIPPNTIAIVMAAYGTAWFLVANVLRIAGAMLGAVAVQR